MENTLDSKILEQSLRECGMITTCGGQGVGKSHENKMTICRYVKDNIVTKVRGRKVLIVDTQGEYSSNEFGKDGIPALEVKLLKLADVRAWCMSDLVEVRRIDVRSLHITEKLELLGIVMSNVKKCLLVLEDLNKIVLSVTHLQDIVSNLIGLRHSAVDVIVSFQSLRAVEPRILDNSRYIRLHYVSGDVANLKNKLGEPEIFKLAQLMVNKRFYDATNLYNQKKINEFEWKKRKSFFVYISTNPYRLEGAFSRAEFEDACVKFLKINKSRLRDQMEITGCSQEQALRNEIIQMTAEYYGNKN